MSTEEAIAIISRWWAVRLTLGGPVRNALRVLISRARMADVMEIEARWLTDELALLKTAVAGETSADYMKHHRQVRRDANSVARQRLAAKQAAATAPQDAPDAQKEE